MGVAGFVVAGLAALGIMTIVATLIAPEPPPSFIWIAYGLVFLAGGAVSTYPRK